MKNHPDKPTVIPEEGESLDTLEDPVSGPVVSGLESTEVLAAEEGAPVHEPMLDTSDPLEVPEQGIEEELGEANIDLTQRSAHDDDEPTIINQATRLG